MAYFIHSTAILLHLNENNIIDFVSQGASSIGLSIGQTWEHKLKGSCDIQQEAYLIHADMDDVGCCSIILQPLKKQQIMLEALNAMSQCILDKVPLLGGKLGSAMQKAVSTLNEAIKQALDGAKSLENSAQELSSSSHALSERSHNLSNQLKQTLTTNRQLDASVKENIEAAESLSNAISGIDSDITQGQSSMEQASTQIDEIRNRVQETQNIVSVIDEIAFKTNILSLNAAVEASRAGEQGRGFSIVAQEVRALAGHSAEQAKEIRRLLNRTYDASESGQKVMQSATDCLGSLFSKIDTIGDSVLVLKQAANNQTAAMQEASISLTGIEQINVQNASSAKSLSDLANSVKDQSQFMRDAMEVFSIQTGFSHPKHQHCFNLAQNAANEIGKTFESAIAQKAIREDDLFCKEYLPINNTNPQKHTTRFDAFCDKTLPAIQEKVLTSNDYISYFIATDSQGYVPTHNTKFSQTLSGNYDKDLVANRTKRIFTDRVGQTCGAHQKEYLIQTYRRDTGEVLMDLSVPIYINGKHWGGIRCGYAL